jgi:DNA-binding transcriptional ArsR family regulator
MIDIPYIAEAAALIGDPARANMLSALKDDGVLSATELALVAGVAPNTASGHLARLTEAGMVAFDSKGRNRFYRLACDEVAEALESIEVLASSITPRHRPRSRNDHAIRYARCCYDHLAGNLGVKLAEGLVQLDYIEETSDGFALKSDGQEGFGSLGVDVDSLRKKRRRFIRRCPDWSEGSGHLGGALAAALFQRFCDLDWLRRHNTSRVVFVTHKGRMAFRKHFGIKCQCFAPRAQTNL